VTHVEFFVCTGWIFGLTSEPLQKELGGEMSHKQNDGLKKKVDELK
jgi:hypothetical protein